MTYSDDPEAGVKEWLQRTKLDTSRVAQPDPHEAAATVWLAFGSMKVLDDYHLGTNEAVAFLAALLREREAAAYREGASHMRESYTAFKVAALPLPGDK